MIVCLLGITCVGKSKIAREMIEMIDSKKKYICFDVDDEIKRKYGTINNFQQKYPDPIKRSIKKQKMMINEFSKKNVIIPVSPLHDISLLLPYAHQRGFRFVEISRDVEDTFERLIYTDDNDNYDEDYTLEVKSEYKDQIIENLKADEEYFSNIYKPLLNLGFFFPGFTSEDNEIEIASIITSSLKLKMKYFGQ